MHDVKFLGSLMSKDNRIHGTASKSQETFNMSSSNYCRSEFYDPASVFLNLQFFYVTSFHLL
jgi:hypothetical protein